MPVLQIPATWPVQGESLAWGRREFRKEREVEFPTFPYNTLNQSYTWLKELFTSIFVLIFACK